MNERAFLKRTRQIDLKLRGRWRTKLKIMLYILGFALAVFVLTMCMFKESHIYNIVTPSGPIPVHRQKYNPAFRRWLDNSTRYNYNYRTVVRPQKQCPSELLVMVTSAPENVRRRQAIRFTWAKDVESMPNRSIVFVIGRVPKNVLVDVRYEMESRGDILMFDFDDSYRNATIKTVLSFKYAADCKPRYLLKADDDTYVNVDRLMGSVNALERALEKPFIAGQVHSAETPHRWMTKWIVNREQYPEQAFPPYVSGNLYVVSGHLLAPMVSTAVYTPPLDLEDVFITGLVATKLSLPRVDIEGVWDRARTTIPFCAYERFVSGHYVEPDDMTRIQDARSSYTEVCTRFLFISWCACAPKLRAVFN